MKLVLALLPSGRQLAALGGTRVAFRAVWSLLPLVLFSLWSEGFPEYASAMGHVAFAAPLVSCGVEKSALLMLPRAHDEAPQVLGAHLQLVVAVAATVLLVGFGVLAGLGEWLSVLALLQAVLLGVVQTQASMLRAQGHTTPESLAGGSLAAGLLMGLGGVWLLGWGPTGLLVWWVAFLLAVLVTLGARLRAESPQRPDQRLRRGAGARAFRMGLGDVSAAAGLSVVYVALSAAGHPDDLARMYTVMAVVSLSLNTLVYLTRLAQPELSRRRLGDGWRRSGLAVGRFVYPAAVLAVLVAGGATVHAAHTSWEPGLLELALLMTGVLPRLVVVMLAHFAFENGDYGTLKLTARYAVVAFAVTGVSAVLLTRPLGAVGAIDAVVAGELTHGLLLAAAARSLTVGSPVAPTGTGGGLA